MLQTSLAFQHQLLQTNIVESVVVGRALKPAYR